MSRAVMFRRRAALVAVGDELLRGIGREENCRYAAEKLTALGWEIAGMEIIADDVKAIVNACHRWIGSVELLVFSGGLGPTHDDKTRNALATFLEAELLPTPLFDEVIKRYEGDLERKSRVEELRFSQGAIPTSAEAIFNPLGTALGICFDHSGTRVLSLPGVPWEFRAMADETFSSLEKGATVSTKIRVVGMGETVLASRISPLLADSSLAVSILPSPEGVTVVLRGEEAAVLSGEKTMRHLLPCDCLPPGVSTLEEALVRAAEARGVTFATAESCTGGLVASRITDVPGCSAVFKGGVVCYADDMKMRLLEVSEAILREDGAVSERCVLAMAEGARTVCKGDMAVAVTGIAGPSGGSPRKPVGTVWIGIADEKGSEATLHRLFGDRFFVRARTTALALEWLWRRVKEK
jgi:nicotinamide-nucleotide amidase